MKNLISIIIPVYNVSDYVEQCINSVINQTIKDIQIIVVDDCGTDDSMQKVKKIAEKDKRIKIISNPVNVGLAEARNIGLQYVNTPYVAFLDSDDWVDSNYYYELYNAIIKNKADIAISDVLYYRNGKISHEWVSNWNFKLNKAIVESIQEKQYNIYACACWNKLYKTTLFKDNNLKFPKGLKIEDVPITTLTTILAKKIVLIKASKLFYRQRNDSIMGLSSGNRTSFDIFKIYEYTRNLVNTLLHNNKNIKLYNSILDNFELFNIYSWFLGTPNDYKNEFMSKMKERFKNISIKSNPFITQESKKIYNLVICNRLLIYTIYIRFCGIIPLCKYEKANNYIRILLFNFIPILKIKKKGTE